MSISIIIPNYNGLSLLKRNLPEISEASFGSEIIVVDDASKDESVKWLKTKYPQIKIVERKINGGFSLAVNDGVAASTGELIFLLNSDAIPQKNFLKYLLPHFADAAVFAVGCLQKSKDKSGFKLEGRGIGTFHQGFLVHSGGRLDKTDTLWVFGGAGMFRKDIWKILGGMESLYSPFYWEDIDLSYRALKSNYKVLFEPKSIIHHQKEKSVIKTYYSPEFIKSISYRNQILFVWLNITDTSYLLKHILYLPFHVVRSLLHRDSAFLSGLAKAILKLPQVLSHRKQHTRLFVRSDKDILC